MKRFVLLAAAVAASAAFAGDVDVRIRVAPGWQFPNYPHRRPARVWLPPAQRVAPYWWYWTPTVVQAPAPPPQVIVLERAPEPEPVPEPAPPPPPPPPQVVVVHVAPEPAPPPPPPAVTIVPVASPAPATPGPDVFSWTDDDGVVHYSTRVPADAKKRAKKLGSPKP